MSVASELWVIAAPDDPAADPSGYRVVTESWRPHLDQADRRVAGGMTQPTAQEMITAHNCRVRVDMLIRKAMEQEFAILLLAQPVAPVLTGPALARFISDGIAASTASAVRSLLHYGLLSPPGADIEELWTTREAGKYWGVSTSRARSIIGAAKLPRRTVYPAEQIRAVVRKPRRRVASAPLP